MGKFVDRFRRIDKWMETAPHSLIALITVGFVFGTMLLILILQLTIISLRS